MTERTPVSAGFLLQRAAKYGLVSAGLFCFASVIATENISTRILLGVLGLMIVGLSFSKLPERLVAYLAQRRGQGYIAAFSVLLPLMLVLVSAMSAAFPLMILLRGYKAPADILVALILEIAIVIVNLIILISNVTASRHGNAVWR